MTHRTVSRSNIVMIIERLTIIHRLDNYSFLLPFLLLHCPKYYLIDFLMALLIVCVRD